MEGGRQSSEKNSLKFGYLPCFSFVNALGIAERAHQLQQLLRFIARNMSIGMYNPFY